MKVRTDFVTNSSSSSFIVMLNSDEARSKFADIASECDSYSQEFSSFSEFMEAYLAHEAYDRYCISEEDLSVVNTVTGLDLTLDQLSTIYACISKEDIRTKLASWRAHLNSGKPIRYFSNVSDMSEVDQTLSSYMWDSSSDFDIFCIDNH